MQHTVVVLQGRNNSGKTETLGMTWDRLTSRPGVVIKRDRREGSREIRCAILEVDGVLVGFISAGDLEDILRRAFNSLIGEKCVVIVCAARSYGDTEKPIASLRQAGWRVQVVPKDRNPAEDEQKAEDVVAEVLAAVQLAAVQQAAPVGA